MEYKYKPFIVSADFDDEPEFIDEKRWVAGAVVDLGDSIGPRFKDDRSRFVRWLDNRLFGTGVNTHPKSLNVFFTFFVCSQKFKDNPTKVYEKYVHIMLTQEKYDPQKAAEWLDERVKEIGEVSEAELTKQLHTFLETEEWDFDSKE